jgi:hypothetical protein
MPRSTLILALAAAVLAAPGFSQVVNPADKQKPPAQEPALTPDDQVSTTTVTAKRVSEYREEDLIGPYGQPQWTAIRRFPTTRVYVRPPGTFEFEYWRRLDFPRSGPTKTITQYEFEIGLPGRFQVDMYLNSNQTGNGGEGGMNGESLEVRWAFADWDKIWGNPTLYLELTSQDQAPDSVEGKLLLGGEMSAGWHWGANLVFEHETSGEMTNEHEITMGVSHVLHDEKFSLGGELKTSLTNTQADRNEFEKELLVGPSMQYRPARNIHIDVSALAGIGPDSPACEAFFVMGYEF